MGNLIVFIGHHECEQIISIITKFILLDIDECEQGEASCEEDEECVNIVGSYRCLSRCSEGYRRNIASLDCEGSHYISVLFILTSTISIYYLFIYQLLCYTVCNELPDIF